MFHVFGYHVKESTCTGLLQPSLVFERQHLPASSLARPRGLALICICLGRHTRFDSVPGEPHQRRC